MRRHPWTAGRREHRRLAVVGLLYLLAVVWIAALLRVAFGFDALQDSALPVAAGVIALALLAVVGLDWLRAKRAGGDPPTENTDGAVTPRVEARGGSDAGDGPRDDRSGAADGSRVGGRGAQGTVIDPRARAESASPAQNDSVVAWILALPVLVYALGFLAAIGAFVFLFVWWYRRDLPQAVLGAAVVSIAYFGLFVLLLDLSLWEGVVWPDVAFFWALCLVV